MKAHWMKWVMVIAPLGFVYAGETFNWNTPNNTVTYIWASAFGRGNAMVGLPQVNASKAASQGESARESDHMLTRAVLVLNGNRDIGMYYGSPTSSVTTVSVSVFECQVAGGIGSSGDQRVAGLNVAGALAREFNGVVVERKATALFDPATQSVMNTRFTEALERFYRERDIRCDEQTYSVTNWVAWR